jgi:C4-dicarboxylate transporter, DctM subunit
MMIRAGRLARASKRSPDAEALGGGDPAATEGTGEDAAERDPLLTRLSARLVDITVVVCALVFAALVADILYEIVGREWLGGAPEWTGDVADYALVWLALLGGSAAVGTRTEPCIRVLVDRASGQLLHTYEGVADGLAVFIYSYLLIYGWQLMSFIAGTKSEAGIPTGYVAAAVPVAGGVMLFHKLTQLAAEPGLIRDALAAVLVALGYLAVQTHALSSIPQSWVYLPLALLLIVGLMFGTPIAESLLAAAAITFGLTNMFSSEVSFTQQVYSGLDVFTLVAVPLFLLTGVIVAYSLAAPSLYKLCKSLLGWLPGGLGVADIGASAIFADISGSAVADTAAMTETFFPELTADGYPPGFAAGMQAAAGTLGLLFPPSISMLLFASVATVSVGALFSALVIPGLLVTVSFAVVCVLIAKRRGYGSRAPFRGKTAARSLWVALPALGTLAIVLGGIFGGVFTATEAGAVAAAYSAVIAALGYRRSDAKMFVPAVRAAVATTGRVGFIISAALVFGWYLIQNNGPQDVVNLIAQMHAPVLVTLVIVILFLVIVSTVLEASTTVLVVVPLLLPLLAQLNVNLVHFAVLSQLASAVGLILPPVGLCLFVVSSSVRVPIGAAAKAALPFVFALAVDIALVLLIPSLTTELPQLLHL